MIYHILLELTCCIIKYMTDVMNSLITVYLQNGFGWEVNTDRYSPGTCCRTQIIVQITCII